MLVFIKLSLGNIVLTLLMVEVILIVLNLVTFYFLLPVHIT